MTNGQFIKNLSKMIFTTSDVGSYKINSWLKDTPYLDPFLKEYIYLKAYIAYVLCHEASTINNVSETDTILAHTYSELSTLFQSDVAGYDCTYFEMMERLSEYTSNVDPQNPNTVCREFLKHVDTDLLITENILYVADLIDETRQNMHNTLMHITQQTPQITATSKPPQSPPAWKAYLWITLIVLLIGIPLKIFLKTSSGSSSLGVLGWILLFAVSSAIYNYFSNRRSKLSAAPDPKKEDNQPQGKGKLYIAIGFVCIIAFALVSNNDRPKAPQSTTTPSQQQTKAPSTKATKPAPPPEPIIATEIINVRNYNEKSDVQTFPIQVTKKDGKEISYCYKDSYHGFEIYIDYPATQYGYFVEESNSKMIGFYHEGFYIALSVVKHKYPTSNIQHIYQAEKDFIVEYGGNITSIKDRGNSMEYTFTQDGASCINTVYAFPYKTVTFDIRYEVGFEKVANSVYGKTRERLKIY